MNRFFSFIIGVFCLFGSDLEGSFQEEIYHFKGIHFLASYCDCDCDALSDIEGLKQAMIDATKKCGATILDQCSYIFPPDGLTMVILLSESHASIHTYPEHGACFIDLFTCGERCSAEKFHEALSGYLKPKKVEKKIFLRKEAIEEPESQTSI
ncbi:MAG: adenosylmethionine decarboxylase [Chlamydiales bacterium]|nr:adenosylmethionine decarboxylase [Chlamydiales bacterium]